MWWYHFILTIFVKLYILFTEIIWFYSITLPDHEIVASFHAWKPVSFLENHILELEDNIFGEIPVPFVKVSSPVSYFLWLGKSHFSSFDLILSLNQVAILSLQSLGGLNVTKIVFAVDPDAKYSKIPPTSQSLIKDTFETMVINDPPLRLTASLFGNTSLFEVLKFPGGITIIPSQSAFLLQMAQIYFNFTLNYSIYQIQVNFDDLTSQLQSGLHLSRYEVRQSSLLSSCHYMFDCFHLTSMTEKCYCLKKF